MQISADNRAAHILIDGVIAPYRFLCGRGPPSDPNVTKGPFPIPGARRSISLMLPILSSTQNFKDRNQRKHGVIVHSVKPDARPHYVAMYLTRDLLTPACDVIALCIAIRVSHLVQFKKKCVTSRGRVASKIN